MKDTIIIETPDLSVSGVSSLPLGSPEELEHIGEILASYSPDDPLFEDEWAEDEASNNFMELELDKVKATITVLGDPEIRRGEIIEIRNVGREWSGEYICFEVEHRIDSGGYVTVVDLKRNAVGGGESVAAGSGGSASGKDSDGSDETKDSPNPDGIDNFLYVDLTYGSVQVPDRGDSEQ